MRCFFLVWIIALTACKKEVPVCREVDITVPVHRPVQEKFDSSFSFSVYPNPVASGPINSRFVLPDERTVEWSIINIQGTTLSGAILNLTKGSHEIKMDIASLLPGIYFIRFRFGEITRISRIVKV